MFSPQQGDSQRTISPILEILTWCTVCPSKNLSKLDMWKTKQQVAGLVQVYSI